MIDPLDPHTNPLDLGPGAGAPQPARAEAAPGVPSIAAERKDARLADEFDLVRVHAPVYVLDKKAAAARSAGAERVAKHRQKLANEGMRPSAVPAALLDEVKTAGGWAEWQAKTAAAAVPPEPVIVEKRVEVAGPERVVEKRVEVQVPAKLSPRELAALGLGKKLQNLTGWRLALARFALGGEEIAAKQ